MRWILHPAVKPVVDSGEHFVGEPVAWTPGPFLDRGLIEPLAVRGVSHVYRDRFSEDFPSDEETALDVFGMGDEEWFFEAVSVSDVLGDPKHAVSG